MIIKKFQKPIVIDADAIFFLRNIKAEILNRDNIIITPHEVEFSRMSSYDLEDIKLRDRKSVV